MQPLMKVNKMSKVVIIGPGNGSPMVTNVVLVLVLRVLVVIRLSTP